MEAMHNIISINLFRFFIALLIQIEFVYRLFKCRITSCRKEIERCTYTQNKKIECHLIYDERGNCLIDWMADLWYMRTLWSLKMSSIVLNPPKKQQTKWSDKIDKTMQIVQNVISCVIAAGDAKLPVIRQCTVYY